MYLSKLITANMNISTKTPKANSKTCHECPFSTNSMHLLTRHRVLMHDGRKSPVATRATVAARGRKRKVLATPTVGGPDPKRQELLKQEEKEADPEKFPVVNQIYLNDSQEMAGLESQQSGDSQNLLDEAGLPLPGLNTLSQTSEPSHPPNTQGDSQEDELLPSGQKDVLNTQEFNNDIEARLDRIDNADEEEEDEVFDDDTEYEEETQTADKSMTEAEYKELLQVARTRITTLEREKAEHEKENCSEQIADLNEAIQHAKLQILRGDKDKATLVMQRVKAETAADNCKDEVKSVKGIVNDLKDRLSVKNKEVDELRSKVGLTGAKLLSLQGAMMSSPPPPEVPASTARPTLQARENNQDRQNRKPPPKEIKCRHSDNDRMCTRPRCGFFHPRATDHCQAYLKGSSCLTQTCKQRHNETERRRYQDSNRSNDRKRNRSDRDSAQNKRRRSGSRSANSRTNSTSYRTGTSDSRTRTYTSDSRTSSDSRNNSPQGHREVSDYSRNRDFARPGRRAAGRSPAHKSGLPSRR